MKTHGGFSSTSTWMANFDTTTHSISKEKDVQDLWTDKRGACEQ